MRTAGRFRTARRGASATEFALILPLMMLIIMGGIDFGRFAHSYIAVNNAARAGASYASMNAFTPATQSNWEDDIEDAVEAELSELAVPGGFDETKLTVTTTTTAEADGLWRFRIVVTYPFEMLIAWPGLPSNVNLRGVIEMRAMR
jgi:Flp pilus assembly protein TadG